MQIEMTQDRLLALYIEALAVSTGYSFTTNELKQHTLEWDFDQLMAAYDALPNEVKF